MNQIRNYFLCSLLLVVASCVTGNKKNTMNNLTDFSNAVSYAEPGSLIILTNGIQTINIKNNIFEDSKTIDMYLVVGEPSVEVQSNALNHSEELIVTGDQKYSAENLWNLAPKFSYNAP